MIKISALLNGGFGNTTGTRIADESDIVNGTFYQHFQSKFAVLVALGRQTSAKRVSTLITEVEQGSFPLDALHSTIAYYWHNGLNSFPKWLKKSSFPQSGYMKSVPISQKWWLTTLPNQRYRLPAKGAKSVMISALAVKQFTLVAPSLSRLSIGACKDKQA